MHDIYCACVCVRDKSRTVTRPVFITPRNFSCDKFRLVLFLYFLEPQSGMKKTLHQKHLPNGWSKIKIRARAHTHSHALHGYILYTLVHVRIFWLQFETFTRESNPLSFSPPTRYSNIYSARAGKVFTANIIYSSVSGFKSRLRVSAELCKRRICRVLFFFYINKINFVIQLDGTE